jgi:hypothetical protein
VSKQRDRHLHRQPAEEFARQAISVLVGDAGDVEVERHSYDWRADDLLIWVRVRQPITGQVLSLFRRQIGEKMHDLFPVGQQFDDWLVVVECQGEELCTVTWRELEREIDET